MCRLVNVNKVRLTGVDQWFKNILDYGLTIPLLILALAHFPANGGSDPPGFTRTNHSPPQGDGREWEDIRCLQVSHHVHQWR